MVSYFWNIEMRLIEFSNRGKIIFTDVSFTPMNFARINLTRSVASYVLRK